MSWKKPDTSYWNAKFAAWWHDPIDKMFNIKEHENWAADYINLFGLLRPNESFWNVADAVAAGFERGWLPSYAQDKSSAVNFSDKPIITHPISGKNGELAIKGISGNPDHIHAASVEYLKKTIGTVYDDSDLAALFKGKEDDFAKARMFFTHLILRFLLAEEDIAGLGALWHRIPADSRFPDHSIWQHNALCSAIHSCMGDAGATDNVGILVYSITPVQSFISQARKLRDFWAGSVILSWLAFAGIAWVIENLGPDHVLYPSLIDQPLVGVYLRKKGDFTDQFLPEMWKRHPKEIASFPNKFVCLVPFDKTRDIALEIENAIRENWSSAANIVCDFVTQDKADEEQKHLKYLFERQTRNTWDLRWAATRLLNVHSIKETDALLDQYHWANQKSYFDKIRPAIKPAYQSNASSGVFYSVTHSLVQSALAAEKGTKRVLRAPEPGEKCQMCGEFEVLHAKPWKEGSNAEDYKRTIKEFWSHWSIEGEKDDVDIKENERLCSICLIKRLMPRIIKKRKEHVLSDVFGAVERFPSTTEMALYDYFKRNGIKDEKTKKEIAQALHENEEKIVTSVKVPKEKTRDKYYAILLMDGDRMGDLVNGKTIAAKWADILHPHIRKRIAGADFPKEYRVLWNEVLSDRRLVTPAIHAAISEALGDFAMYGAAEIIKAHDGCLVYAGGDDVCAFLPISHALDAAQEIRNYYISVFRHIDANGRSIPIDSDKEWQIRPGKLSINLGNGDGISISSSILICHHKESLSQMIARAHSLLDGVAKQLPGKDACVLELRKRHGGERMLVSKWEDTVWDAVKYLSSATSGTERTVSHSLLYRLEKLRPGFEALIDAFESPVLEEKVEKLIAAQLEKSNRDKSGDERPDIKKWIRQIVLRKSDGAKQKFDAEALQITAFMGGEEDNG